MSFAVGILTIALQAGRAIGGDGEVDWRPRKMGSDLLFAFDLEDDRSNRTGGGTGIEEHGTVHDRVYAEEDGALLGVRTVTRTYGTSSRTEVRFFRLTPGGMVEDDAPLDAFQWHAPDGFVFSDPLGASAAELRPGLDRERLIQPRVPEFRRSFGDPVRVRETTQGHPDEQSGLGIVLHQWRAQDEDGIRNAVGDCALLDLEDRCVFEMDTGVMRERRLEFRFFRPSAPQMIQRLTCTVREVAWSEMPGPLEREGKALRAAYWAARARPRDALNELSEWASQAPSWYLRDVAAEIALMAIMNQSDLARLVDEVSKRHPPAEWAAFELTDETCFEAVQAGRLSATLAHAGLDDGRHRAAYLAHLAHSGHEPPSVEVLGQIHDLEADYTLFELEERYGVTFDERQKAEAGELLRARLLKFGQER